MLTLGIMESWEKELWESFHWGVDVQGAPATQMSSWQASSSIESPRREYPIWDNKADPFLALLKAYPKELQN